LIRIRGPRAVNLSAQRRGKTTEFLACATRGALGVSSSPLTCLVTHCRSPSSVSQNARYLVPWSAALST